IRDTASGWRGDEPGFSPSAGAFPPAALPAAQPAIARRPAPNTRTKTRDVMRISFGEGLANCLSVNCLSLKDALRASADWILSGLAHPISTAYGTFPLY